MTGDELVKMMQLAGVSSPHLAKMIGWKSAWRVYEARRQQSDNVKYIIERALEQILTPARFERALTEIRTSRDPAAFELLEIDKGVNLPAQMRRDLVAIASARKVRIKVYRTTTKPLEATDDYSQITDEDNRYDYE